MTNQVTPAKPQKLSRTLGLGMLLLGAFFLFDPYLSAFDILPDFLGYLFLSLALYRVGDLDNHLAEAARNARRLALVGVVRLLAVIFTFGFVSSTEQPVFVLLVAFSLAVINAILFIPMWKNFKDGMIYLGSRHSGTAVFARREGGLRSTTERYALFSTVYFILRETLAVLPELTVLGHEKGGAESVGVTTMYDFVGLIRGVCVSVSLVIGFVWLVYTAVYVCKLCLDKPFLKSLTEKYRADVLTRHDLFAMRSVRLSLGLLIAAAVLSLDLYLDGYNMIPDFLPGILMIASVIIIRRYGKAFKTVVPALTVSVLYTVSTTVTWFMQIFYLKQTQLSQIMEDDELYARYQTSSAQQVLTAILFCVAVILILSTLHALVKKYTGLRAFRAESNYSVERTDAIHKVIRRKLILVGVFAVFTALSTLYSWVLIPMLPTWEELLRSDVAMMSNLARTVVTVGYQIMTEGYWFVDLAIGGGFIAFLLAATGEISEQMEYSYMMKD